MKTTTLLIVTVDHEFACALHVHQQLASVLLQVDAANVALSYLDLISRDEDNATALLAPFHRAHEPMPLVAFDKLSEVFKDELCDVLIYDMQAETQALFWSPDHIKHTAILKRLYEFQQI